jgi:hypothetical protein
LIRPLLNDAAELVAVDEHIRQLLAREASQFEPGLFLIKLGYVTVEVIGHV